jgi:hypothetical protein
LTVTVLVEGSKEQGWAATAGGTDSAVMIAAAISETLILR